MSALVSALLPTHAFLADCIKGAPLPVRAEPAPSIAKYLIVQERPGAPEQPIVFSRDIAHAAMLPMGLVCLSAGFLTIYAGGVIVPFIGSETLRLDPRPQDRDLLARFLSLK